jgi:hypothetical protein
LHECLFKINLIKSFLKRNVSLQTNNNFGENEHGQTGAEFFIGKVSVKDYDSRVLTLVHLDSGVLEGGGLNGISCTGLKTFHVWFRKSNNRLQK